MPRDEIPRYGTEQSCKNHVRIHLLDVKEPAADGFRHGRAEAKRGYEIPKRRPCDALKRR